MDTSEYIKYAIDLLALVGTSSIAAAIIPKKILSFLAPLINLLAMNWGHAANRG